MEEKKWCIYIHTSPSNKAYIGITSQSVESRWQDGKGYLYKTPYGEYKQPAIANAINKYGWDNFTHIVWADNLSKNQACLLESLLIDLFDTRNPNFGYNIQQGGSVGAVGLVMSEESKRRLSEAKKGRPSPRKGAVLSNESKEKISQARKKNWEDKAYRQNQIEQHKWQTGENHPMYGKHHTEDTKEKIRNARKGSYLTDETKEKLSKANSGSNNPFYGKKHTEESRKKMSESLRGINSPNTKRVIQFDKQGNFIQIWDYIKQAAEALGINNCSIGACCRGSRKTAGGFKWEYADEEMM